MLINLQDDIYAGQSIIEDTFIRVMIGQEVPIVTLDTSQDTPLLMIIVPEEEPLQTLEFVLESVHATTSDVYFRDTITIEIIAKLTTPPAIDLILSDLIAPVFTPEPPETFIIVESEYFSYAFGLAAADENGISIITDMGIAESFIRFDEISRTLVINEGVGEIGSYMIKISISRTTEFGVATTEYTIQIIITPIPDDVVDDSFQSDEDSISADDA